MSDHRDKVVENFIWRFAERCGAQLVGFVVTIVIARMVSPEAFGTVALITVVTSVLQVFVDSGLGTSLIQRKDADNLDFSSVFYFNMGMCLLLYIVLYLLAPWIAVFYEQPQLTPMIRVLGITIVVSGLKNVQQAYVARNMLFKRFFYATLTGTLISAVIGIGMAYLGYGVWALILQQLSNTLIDTIILWWIVKWRPVRHFSWKRLQTLLSYGWKLLASALLDTVYNNTRQLIIGKQYSSSDLAFYNKGEQFPYFVVANINTSFDSVLLPTMSRQQDSCEAVRNITRRVIKISTYVMAPCMMGLAFMGDILVPVLLTSKWSPCVFYLRIFCVTYMFYPIHTANLNAIKAMGRSDIFLKLELIKKSFALIVLCIAMRMGLHALAYSALVVEIVAQLVNTYPNKKLLGYGYLEQIRDIVPSILLAVGMGIIVYFIPVCGLPAGITIGLQILCGMCVYIAASFLLKLEAFSYLLQLLRHLRDRLQDQKKGDRIQ